MAYLSFADLIAGPSRLSPTEAAALTLAVAQRLEDERATGRDMPIPDDNGILLSSTGTVAFVRGSDAAVSDEPAGLSALLMRLLRLEEGGPRAHVPGGLLVVLARNLGYIQLPPTSPDAFRAALERFATSDATLLAGIFWRAARPKGALPRRDAAGATRDRPRPQVDRRRRGASVTDLRRALRELECELFQVRSRLTRRAAPLQDARGRPQMDVSRSGVLRWAAVAAAALFIASMATGRGAGSAPAEPDPSSVWLPPMAPVEMVPAPPAIEVSPSRDPDVMVAIATVPRSEPEASPTGRKAPKRQASGASRVVHASRRAPPRTTKRPIPATTIFAGGTRGIAWAR